LSWWGVPTVIYSNDSGSGFFIERLQKRPDFGYKPVLILNANVTKPGDYKGIPILKSDDAIHEIIKKLNIKVAIIIETKKDETLGQPLNVTSMYRYTLLIPYMRTMLTSSISIRDFGGILAFASTHNLTKRVNLFVKRHIDLFMLVFSSPVVLPVIAFITILVKVTSPGPAFFGHNRIGQNGKTITTWKFRSMVQDAEVRLQKVRDSDTQAREQWAKNRKIENDPRITPLGKFLRKTSLDELPQFWNIFLGDMSFVGPRPVTKDELDNYGYKDKKNYVLSVKPGLSGMWQISGRSETGYEERILLDSYYIQNWSIWLDIWIIIQTVWVVFRGKGAY
jgi:Undecaprenyl-phosphate galactose phosphotransferase WbaP